MLRKSIQRHSIAAFVFIAFGWTWTWDAIYYSYGWWETLPTTIPRQWGVPLGAIIVIWANDIPLKTWVTEKFEWRVHPGWYLVAVLVPFVVTNVQPMLRALGGGSVTYAPPGSLPLIVAFVLLNMLILGGTEELGWRGFLQPRLQEGTSVFTAGLGIGVLWWAWHLPLFLGHQNYVLEPMPFLQYTVFVIGISAVLGAFVNVTGGRVLPVMLMHASTNLGALFENSGGALEHSPLVSLAGSGLWWLVALGLVALFGWSMVPNSKRETLA